MTPIYAHYVCFSCRKSWAPAPARNGLIPDTRTCPSCGKELLGLGLTFRPPKKRNRRAWKRLQLRAETGDRFLKVRGIRRPDD